MAKSILKEIIIILLLGIILVLLLGILFYNYMPNSKTLPAKVQEYALDEDVKQELSKELNNINSEEIVKTYRVDATDIERYEKTNDYDKGKINPFAIDTTGTQDTNNNVSTGNGNNNENSNNTTINPSKDNFLNTTGK